MDSERTEQIRALLFGDQAIDAWPEIGSDLEGIEPWRSFVDARQAIENGEEEEAIALLKEIVSDEGLESRHYLQAWHFLRQLGVEPPAEIAKRVYGGIVEVALPDGLDILVAYADGTARYFNYAGGAIIWERPDESLQSEIDEFLAACGTVVSRIGPWDGKRPPAPESGTVRLNVLVPSGLHYGEGEFEILAEDPLGGPMIATAFGLMQGLIKKNQG